MPIIRVVNSLKAPKTHQVESGILLSDWCVENMPRCFNYHELKTKVILNDRQIADIDTLDKNEILESLDVYLFDGDIVTIAQSARDAGAVLDPVGSLILSPINIAFDAFGSVIEYLYQPPDLPNNQGQQSTSPNSLLKAATNSFRNRQAIPNKSGLTFSTPDFLQPSYFEYESNRKTVYELFSISENYAVIGNVSSGENAFLAPSSTYEIYNTADGDIVPTDIQKTVVPANDINNETLPPPDSKSFLQSVDTDFVAPDIIKIATTETLIEDFELGVGSWIRVDNGTEAGDYEILDIQTVGLFYEIQIDGSVATTSYNVDYVRVVSDGGSPAAITPVDGWSDYVTLKTSSCDDVWFHIVAPRGLQSDGGNRITVQFEFEVVALRTFPAATTSYTITSSISGTDTTQKAKTVKLKTFNPAANLANADQIQVRARRTTNEFSGNAVQEVSLESVVYVDNQTSNDYSDLMIMSTVRKAVIFGAASRQSKTNCIHQTQLKLFNTSTGMQETTYTSTRQAADYIFYLLYDVAGYQLDAIDTDSLFDIRDNLAAPELGYFDYSFDDKDISLEQRVKTAANAMRCTVYKASGRVWTFIRDEPQPVAAIISPRIMVGTGEVKSSNGLPSSKDSVSLRYVDPDTNTNKFIERRINKTTFVIENGVGDNVLDIEMDYCRNENQAIDRADLEVRKLLYLGLSATVEVYGDGFYIGLGERVKWADPLNNDFYGGEILGFDGVDTFTTSNEFNPTDGATYKCYITDEQGVPSAEFEVTPLTGNDKRGFVGVSPPTPSLANKLKQQGSQYIIASEDNINLTDWTIVDIDGNGEDRKATLTLAQYNESVFENDYTGA